jgi:predicted nucleic acid-binding protein
MSPDHQNVDMAGTGTLIPDQEDKSLTFRITDKGALEAVLLTTNALMHISSYLSMRRITTVDELVKLLKDQLRKCLGWLDRVPDGTLFKRGITRKELNHIKKNAKAVLGWNIVPSNDDFEKAEASIKQWEALQQQKEQPVENRIRILADSSFLLSYLSGSDTNAPSAKVIVAYLKTQRRFFDFCLPNLVLLEVISKLKQKHSFKKARLEFERLLEEICEGRVAISDTHISVFEIFDRYERFSKKRLSSSLRSNDFIIATDGILIKAMVLTCDRKMHEGIKKTYRDAFLITESPKSYLSFINSFEKRKASSVKVSSARGVTP